MWTIIHHQSWKWTFNKQKHHRESWWKTKKSLNQKNIQLKKKKKHEKNYINKKMHGYFQKKLQQDVNTDIKGNQLQCCTKQMKSYFEGLSWSYSQSRNSYEVLETKTPNWLRSTTHNKQQILLVQIQHWRCKSHDQ